MEFKGTKDWKIVKLKATGFYKERTEIQFGNDGECVAEFVHNDYDAKLIEVAPILLEELITLLSNIDEMGNTGEDMRELRTYLSDARKAINKALN